MNKLSWSLVLSLLLSLFFSRSSQGEGEVGNNNPTGVTGEYYGSIVTGGSYDPLTGNAKRFVDDLTVTGSIGAYPLKWTRVLNSRGSSGLFGDGSGWRHSYQWGLTIRPMPTPNPLPCAPPEPPAGTVSYPEGGVVMFHREVDNGVETWLQADGREPMGDRIVHRGGPDYDLSLKDGGRVEFRIVNGERVAKNIVDPHGQTTQLEYDLPKRLRKITEPGGRYLLIHYHTYDPEPPAYPAAVEVIDKVEVYDGPQARLIEKVQYAYERENASGMLYVRYYYLQHASYDDGSQATYHNLRASRIRPNEPWSFAAGKVETCEDVRFAGAMRNIKYTYVAPIVSLTHPVAWGQIESERNLTTNVEVSKVRYPTDADCPANSGNLACGQRTETRADGAKRVFQYGSVASPYTESYTDFAYPGGPHHATTNSYIDPVPGTTDRYLKIVTNARGYHTSTEKDYNLGAVMAVIHHNGSRIKYTYDPNNPHHIASQEDENGHITHFDRYGAPGFPPDPFNPNRIWRIRYPDGGFEVFAYNNFGQVRWHLMTSGGEEDFIYDDRGLKQTYWPPSTESDLARTPTRYFYYGGPSGPGDAPDAPGGPMRPDLMDRLQRVIDPRGNSTWYQYNGRGQVTRVTYSGGTFTQNSYNPDGTLQWTEDELGHRTSYLYDEYKRVIKTTNAVHKETDNSYAPWNGHGPLSHTTSSIYLTTLPSQKKIKRDYDSNFRLVETTQGWNTADSATTINIYDEVGNLWKVKDPKGYAETGLMTVYGYDDRNRRESVTDAR
jgi:YD repeat-containing protein